MKQINKMMTGLLSVALLLLVSMSASAQLNGTYTVYGAGADYPNLQSAASALSSGVSGPVTFRIRPGTWSSSSTSIANIGNVSGASATNTITFEAENGSATTTIIQNSSTSSSTSSNHIFYLNSAKYVRVKNLTLRRTSSTYACAVRFAGSAQYNIVENCLINGGGTSTSSSNYRIYGTSLSSAHNNIIRNNTIDQGYYGIYWRGSGSSYSSMTKNNEISGNKLTNIYRYGIYNYYTSDHHVIGNEINPKGTSTFYGIYAYYCDDGFKFDDNEISKSGVTSSSFYPIYAYYCDGAVNNSNRGSFSGNEINVNSSTTTYGMRIYYGNRYSINDNEITVTGNGTKYPVYNYNYSSSSRAYGNSVYFEGNEITATTNNSGSIYLYTHYYYQTDVKFNNNEILFNGKNGSQYIYAGYYYTRGCEFNNNEITMNSTTASYREIDVSYYYGEDGCDFIGNKITINGTGGSYVRMYAAYYMYQSTKPFKINNNEVTINCPASYIYNYLGYYVYQNNVPNEFKDNKIEIIGGSSTYGYNYCGYYLNGCITTGNDIYVQTGRAAYGLMCYGYSSGTIPWVIKNNKVVAKGGSSTVYGMYPYYCYQPEIANNSVYAKGTSTTYGLMSSYNNGGANIYNNTVYAQSTSTCYTVYSYQSSGSQSAKFRNNIFHRGTGGSGYLFYGYTPSRYDMDYNNWVFNGRNIYFSGAQYSNITALRAGTGMGMNSLSYAPAYMNLNNGDLRPDPSAPASWAANGRGVQITGNNADINGAARAETTIAGVPDLGAYEFTPTSTPPDCDLTPATPSPSSTQVVRFGEDTVAVLRWDAVVPSNFAVKQYTGTNPPGILSINPTQMFYYVDFQGTGTSLDYEQDLYFKEPWLGTIASKSALRLAEKVGTGNWAGYPPANSSANIVRNFIHTPSVDDVGALFTGIDISNNAGADMIVEPASPFCPGTYTVKLLVKNNGNNILNSLKIGWELNGTPQGTINHTTPININGSSQGNEAVITLGTVTFGSAAVNIKAWTYDPNGVTDPVPTDDTLHEDYFAALSGVYTVGGTSPDFNDVVAANNALKTYGTCGDVIFDIRPGVYTGQLNVSSVPNVGGGTAHVTFRSTNSNPATTAISYAATGTGDLPTIDLNGAHKFTFENLGIRGTNPSYGTGVNVSGISTNDTFRGCSIEVGPGTSSYLRGVYNSGAAGCSDNVFDNCKISTGYYGIYWYTSGAPYTQGITVKDCDITAYYYGMYLGYVYDANIVHNKVNGSQPTTSYYGIYLYSYNPSNYSNITNVVGNRVTNFRGYSFYMYYPAGTTNNRGKIMNNAVISSNATLAYYPGMLYYPTNVDIMNNTFINNGTSSTSYYAAYLYLSSYRNNNVYNNVFANLAGGNVLYSYYLSGYNNVVDYNNLYTTSNSLFTAGTPSSSSFTAWRNASKQDAHSVTYDPIITSATNPAPRANHPGIWALNGHGKHFSGNVEDIDGNTRIDVRANGVPDIGAFEVDPEVAPPAATANPAVADKGDTQVFTFAGNEVGRITWGYTTPVVPVTVQQYSGEKAAGVAAAANPSGSMYFHTDVTPAGNGTTYDFDLNVDFMDIWLGDIATKGNLRMAHKVPSYPWMVYSGSLSSMTPSTAQDGGNLDAPTLNRFGSYTGLENNSVPSAFVRAQGSVIICYGNSVVLNAEPQNGDNYTWYRNGVAIPGASGPNAKSYTATQAGDYSVGILFTNTPQGTKTVESVPVTVSTIAAPNAIITSNGNLTYCQGNGLTLNAGSSPGVTYQWQLNGNDIPGATNNTYPVQQAGSYTLVATNVGCSSVSTVTPVSAGPLTVSLGNDTSYCEVKNQYMTLDAGFTGAKYRWSTGDTTRTIEVRQGGDYWVEVNAGPNCIDKDTIGVTIDPLPKANGISFVQNGNDYTFFPSGPIGAVGFLWLFSDGTTSTQSNPSKQIKGDLYVRLVMFNACGSDTLQLGWPLSVNEAAEGQRVSVYPNPAKDQVTLSATGIELKTVEVLNSLGAVVYRGEASNGSVHSINVSQLASGHYMLRATTESDGLISKQFDVVR